MSRRKQSNRSPGKNNKRHVEPTRQKNKTVLVELLHWFAPVGELFSKNEFHGNIKWNGEQLAAQALIWSWQETKYVTDAFEHTQEVFEDLGLKDTVKSYTSMMNALHRYHDVFALDVAVGSVPFERTRSRTCPRNRKMSPLFCTVAIRVRELARRVHDHAKWAWTRGRLPEQHPREALRERQMTKTATTYSFQVVARMRNPKSMTRMGVGQDGSTCWTWRTQAPAWRSISKSKAEGHHVRAMPRTSAGSS